MDIGLAPKVVGLINRIAEYRQAIAMIDAGADVVAMTLRAKPVTPVTREEPPPDEEDEESPPPWAEAVVEETPSEVTISTEELTYPPQMLDSIRSQELQLWQEAYQALQEAGVTGAPQPPEAGAKVEPRSQAASPAPREVRRRPPKPVEGETPAEPETPVSAAPAPASAPSRAATPAPKTNHRHAAHQPPHKGSRR